MVALSLAMLSTSSAGGAAATQPSPTTDSMSSQVTTLSTARTVAVAVRPVRSSGAPNKGWKVVQASGSVSCGAASPAALNGAIAWCGSSADYLPACWKSTRTTVLCLRDVAKRTLVRIKLAGTFPRVTAPKQPSPLNLRLTDKQYCSIRLGGAWGSPPSMPDAYGTYWCTKGDLYATTGDGLNRKTQPWSVREWLSGTKDTIVTKRVATAYFVGTAR